MDDADLIQDSPEWRMARCGSVGASEVPDIIRVTKTGPAASRANLLTAKALERVTGVPINGYASLAMKDGKEREPEARSAYELVQGVEIELVGLIRHPEIEGAHASPDGIIADPLLRREKHGLVEIKCPQLTAHLDILDNQKIPSDYLTQMQWQMACTHAAWCDFVSYNPAFPPNMQLFIKRVERDEFRISELEAEVRKFLFELSEKVTEIRNRYGDAMSPSA